MMTPKTYSLFSEEIWDAFCTKIGNTEKEFKKKTYLHFDRSFDFLKNKDKIKELVSDKSLKKISKHSFSPFIKILTKTPRYRYQKTKGEYGLETKIRPISFASHFDSYIYAFYSFALNEKYQKYIKSKCFDASVLAYRNDLGGKCNIQFAKEVFDEIKDRLNEGKTCTAIGLDISGYFDNIDHTILKNKWCKILSSHELPIDQYKVFRTLTKYSYIGKFNLLKHFGINLKQKRKNGEKWYTILDLIDDSIIGNKYNDKFNLLRQRNLIVTNLPKKNDMGEIQFKGIPQGSPISSVLSNIYLIDFDEWLYNLSNKWNFFYRRYCDDLLIVSDDGISEKVKNEVLRKISEYNLIIQDKKTELVKFMPNSKGKIRGFNLKKINEKNVKISRQNEKKYYKNLQYLGFEFSGQKIYLRPSSLSRYFRKMKGRIVKTVVMAYSDNSNIDNVLKKQLYTKYSHHGKRNFLTYAKNASKKTYFNSKGEEKEGMDSNSIKKQVSSHIRILKKKLDKTIESRILTKSLRGKLLKKKY